MARGQGRDTAAWIAEMLPLIEARQPISVRGVCYLAFVNGLLPSMAESETKKVSRMLTIAREQCDVPWEWIVDATREIEHQGRWNDPASILRAVARDYRKDLWRSQPERLLIVSEKATVAGTIAPILDEFGLPFTVLHGWGSATAVHDLAKLSTRDTRPLTLLYIGDLDPSGAYMSEVDLPDRIDRYWGVAELERVAILPEHIAAYGLPTFQVASKLTDSRYPWFIRTHGRTCAELDALDPRGLRGLVQDAIERHIDADLWERELATEKAEQASLRSFITAYNGLQTA